MRMQVGAQGVKKGREQIQRFHKPRISRASRRIGAWVRVVHQHRHTDTGFVEQFFLTQPVVTKMVAMITGQDDHGILQPPLRFQELHQAAKMIVNLFDQGHIGRNNVVAYLIALKAATLFVLHERGHYRMRLLAFSGMPPGWYNMWGPYISRYGHGAI